MPEFSVPDMHCDGCVRSITKAVQGAVPAATVEADLASHTVKVSTGATETIAEAMRDAGFSPELKAA